MNNNNIKFIILVLSFIVILFILNFPSNNLNGGNGNGKERRSGGGISKYFKNDDYLKDYPFQQVDKKQRFRTHFFKPMTMMYKKFPDIGKIIHYCRGVDGENVTISFQEMYENHKPTLEIYFNHYFDFAVEDFPKEPSNKVPRVLHSLEPPYQRVCTEYQHCSDKFNWSISYERTADIKTGHCDDEEIFNVVPWELDKFVMENKTKFSLDYMDRLKNNISNGKLDGGGDDQINPKYPLASWFCSKCNIHLISNRLEYVREMMKYIKVDSYGTCLNNVPKTNKTSRTALDVMDIKQSLISNYKFYLSFESSNCLDYTTEKPLHALKVGSVPIVMGHPQTLKYLPDGSYIYVGDYKNVKHLTDYLVYLDQHDDEYLKYFDWRFNQSILEKWININGYPTRPNSRNWVCPLYRHYQLWTKGKIPSKTLNSIPYNDLCLPPSFIKI